MIEVWQISRSKIWQSKHLEEEVNKKEDMKFQETHICLFMKDESHYSLTLSKLEKEEMISLMEYLEMYINIFGMKIWDLWNEHISSIQITFTS